LCVLRSFPTRRSSDLRIFTLFFRLLRRRACCSWQLSFRYAPSLPFGLLGVLRFSTCSTALQLSDTPRHLVRLFGFVSVVLRALFTCLFIDLFCEFRQFFVGGLFLFKSLFQQRSVIRLSESFG